MKKKEEDYKKKEVMERQFASLKDIDPSKVIAFSDYDHKENWVVEKRWFGDRWSLERGTVYHTPDKQEAVDYVKTLMKDKKSPEEGGKFSQYEHWYVVCFGYPFYDNILRTWTKTSKTKPIPFDAKIRLIIHEDDFPDIGFFAQDNEYHGILMEKTLEKAIEYLTLTEINKMPNRTKLIELLKVLQGLI